MSFPESFDPRNCILFLGAGFSFQAINRVGTNLPTAHQLKKIILTECGLPDSSLDHSLSKLAEFAATEGINLNKIISNNYQIDRITEAQDQILSLPWRRIYTTNYDDIVSFKYAEQGKLLSNLIHSHTDAGRKRLEEGAVVHLHGLVSNLSKNSVEEELVLSQSSYVQSHSVENSWWNHFSFDCRNANHIFFLGYGLGDPKPEALLMQSSSDFKRRHFFLREANDPVSAQQFRKFGNRYDDGIEGFAERIKISAKPTVPTMSPEDLTTIDPTLTPQLGGKELRPKSYQIQDLLLKGLLDAETLRHTWDTSEYAIFREAKIQECQEALNINHTLLIHSSIGNGKTVFCESLKYALLKAGIPSFSVRPNLKVSDEDLEFITSTDKSAIFFPSMDSVWSNLNALPRLTDKHLVIVEVRTGELEIRNFELPDIFPNSYAQVSVENIDQQDRRSLQNLLSESALSNSLPKLDSLKQNSNSLEFREILLACFDDPEVGNRINGYIDPLLQTPKTRRLLTILCLTKSSGKDLDVQFLRAILREDPFAIVKEKSNFFNEIASVTSSSIQMRSPILSSFILKNCIDPIDFTNQVLGIVTVMARTIQAGSNLRYEQIREARSIISSVLRFRALQQILDRHSNYLELIENLYEDCREKEKVRAEPLFWLQYSMYFKEIRNYEKAETHIQEAYSRADKIKNFKTFQIDTNYLSLICDMEMESGSTNFDHLSEFEEQLLRCLETLPKENQRWHTIWVLSKIGPLIKTKASTISAEDSVGLKILFNKLSESLRKLDTANLAKRRIAEIRRAIDSVEEANFALTDQYQKELAEKQRKLFHESLRKSQK